ncbi:MULTISPECIES: AraC family transcriptional regulator [unclassified Nocardioides]|uniref:AraC family transcriptional regulator n=1 Tax=unclassified Nocardioides TaxID=2615069 RepID=UPI0006FB76DA|nr:MULTISPECIES: AraC family transcriptional regulator [unclassified Nocardioides]KRA32376.1 AraC family transcriptional regulator [Nocardioides sp. Root614]KRA89028.1 AraC family transcriptional regulator [Nocardioides sp. Root682]
MGSLIRATNMWGYVDLVRELGGDPEALLARFGIPFGIEHQDDTFVPVDPFVRLLATSAEELDCPDFGMRMSQWQGLAILGPIAVIARNSATVAEAFGSIARYFYVHSPALHLAMVPRRAGERVRFDYRMSELGLPVLRQGYELSMANGARIVRLLGGPDASYSSVSFLHQQLGSDASYAATLECPVAFGQSWCGFEVEEEIADRPLGNADDETRRIATKYLESQVLPRGGSFVDRVEELVQRLLPTGHCTAEIVAAELLMHRRTLQRQLEGDGTSFAAVLDRQRRNLAERYLAEPMLQLGQVARMLGYSEQASLNRSAQRWFGTTPTRYRRDL